MPAICQGCWLSLCVLDSAKHTSVHIRMNVAKEPAANQRTIACRENVHIAVGELGLYCSGESSRICEELEECRRAVVGCNTIDNDLLAAVTPVNDHQLAAAITGVFIPTAFCGQPDRLHPCPACGQPVAGRAPIEMARPQAIRTMVTVLHAGKARSARNILSALEAREALLAEPSMGAAPVYLLTERLVA